MMQSEFITAAEPLIYDIAETLRHQPWLWDALNALYHDERMDGIATGPDRHEKFADYVYLHWDDVIVWARPFHLWYLQQAIQDGLDATRKAMPITKWAKNGMNRYDTNELRAEHARMIGGH